MEMAKCLEPDSEYAFIGRSNGNSSLMHDVIGSANLTNSAETQLINLFGERNLYHLPGYMAKLKFPKSLRKDLKTITNYILNC